MANGGDIREITFNNPEVGSGVFKPKASEGNSYDPGGLRNVDDKNSVTADGEAINTMNMVLGFFQVLIANDMNVRKEMEKLVAIAGSLSPTTWTITIINGISYRGVGRVVGDITGDIDKATIPLKVNGMFKQI